jgi:hypothetical protein
MESHHISPGFAGVADFTAGQESSSIMRNNLAPKILKQFQFKELINQSINQYSEFFCSHSLIAKYCMGLYSFL